MKLFTPLILMCLLIGFTSSSAFAFIETHWSGVNRRIYVVVAGEGFDDMGSQFAKSAMSQAKKIRDFDASAEILLFAGTGEDQVPSVAQIKRWAPEALTVKNDSLLTGSELFRQLLNLHSIAGIFIYSHSSPLTGMALQSGEERFSAELKNMSSLRGHFTEDAILMIFGCNSGFSLAESFSQVFNIPAMGSLTSTNFQQLHSNGNFYANDRGMHPSGSWAAMNKESYRQAWKCPDGQCLRMKSDNVSYNGIWGKFTVGLGFYKWFCPNGNQAQCLQGMKRGAQLWVGPVNLSSPNVSENQVKAFIDDFFCPEDESFSRHKDCAAGIANALRTGDPSFSAFEGTSLNCTFDQCAVDLRYTDADQTKIVTVPQLTSAGSSTMMDEVHAYRKAFGLE